MFMLSLFLQTVLQQSAASAGRVLAVGTVLMAVLAPISGSIGDRIGPRRVAACGVVFVMVSAGLGSRIDPALGALGPIAVVSLQGAGFGLFSSSNMSAIMGAVSAQRVGLASSLAAMSRHVGMMSGMLVTSAMIALHVGDARIHDAPGAFHSAVKSAYAVLVVTASLSLAVAIRGQLIRVGARIKSRG